MASPQQRTITVPDGFKYHIPTFHEHKVSPEELEDWRVDGSLYSLTFADSGSYMLEYPATKPFDANQILFARPKVCPPLHVMKEEWEGEKCPDCMKNDKDHITGWKHQEDAYSNAFATLNDMNVAEVQFNEVIMGPTFETIMYSVLLTTATYRRKYVFIRWHMEEVYPSSWDGMSTLTESVAKAAWDFLLVVEKDALLGKPLMVWDLNVDPEWGGKDAGISSMVFFFQVLVATHQLSNFSLQRLHTYHPAPELTPEQKKAYSIPTQEDEIVFFVAREVTLGMSSCTFSKGKMQVVKWHQMQKNQSKEKPSMCDECGVSASTRCSRCKKVYYCGKVCQAKGWKTHKPNCTQ